MMVFSVCSAFHSMSYDVLGMFVLEWFWTFRPLLVLVTKTIFFSLCGVVLSGDSTLMSSDS